MAESESSQSSKILNFRCLLVSALSLEENSPSLPWLGGIRGAGRGWGNYLRGAESRKMWDCWEHVGDSISQISHSFLVQDFGS